MTLSFVDSVILFDSTFLTDFKSFCLAVDENMTLPESKLTNIASRSLISLRQLRSILDFLTDPITNFILKLIFLILLNFAPNSSSINI